MSDFPTITANDPLLHLKTGLIARDHQTLEVLYNMYSGAVYNIALRIVKSQDLAANVLQDTFVKIWKNGDKYNPSKGGLFTWIVNIARNTAIDATRTGQFKKMATVLDIDSIQHLLSAYHISTDAIGIMDTLKRMNFKHLELIEKIYFEGYTQSEIEEESGIPLGTIKTRLRKAMLELRRAFGQDLSNYKTTSRWL